MANSKQIAITPTGNLTFWRKIIGGNGLEGAKLRQITLHEW
jgi:hypothetical protein